MFAWVVPPLKAGPNPSSNRMIGVVPNIPLMFERRKHVFAPRVALQRRDTSQHETSPQSICRYILYALPISSFSSISPMPRSSVTQSHREHDETNVRPKAQSSQNHNRIPTCPKFLPPHAIIPHLTEELSVSLISSVQTH